MSRASRIVAIVLSLALGAGSANAQDVGNAGGAPPPSPAADAPAAEPTARTAENSPADASPAEAAVEPAIAPVEAPQDDGSAGSEPSGDAEDDPQGLFEPEQLSKLLDALRGSDPDEFNGLLDGLSRERSLGRFLEDVNFRFKAFDAEDARDTASLGFSYDFHKALEVSPGESSSMSLVLRGRGNVAFDQRANPEDFLDTGFELHFFGARYSDVDLDALDARLADPATFDGPAEPGREPPNRFQTFFTQMADEDAELETVFADPTWNDLKHAIGDLLGDECFWDFAAHASVESNQDFSSLQYAYGLQYGMVIRDWSPDSNRTRFNLFDYPFAALRCLTGMQSDFTPSGRAWPSLLVGLDLVDPAENASREALDETDPFARARAELGMKAPLAVLDDGVVWCSLGYRYYRELDPPSAIERAGLDEQSYFAASLDFPQGWFLRYSTGTLPIDARDDSAFELGWSHSF